MLKYEISIRRKTRFKTSRNRANEYLNVSKRPREFYSSIEARGYTAIIIIAEIER